MSSYCEACSLMGDLAAKLTRIRYEMMLNTVVDSSLVFWHIEVLVLVYCFLHLLDVKAVQVVDENWLEFIRSSIITASALIHHLTLFLTLMDSSAE